jgi:hypothetical protein
VNVRFYLTDGLKKRVSNVIEHRFPLHRPIAPSLSSGHVLRLALRVGQPHQFKIPTAREATTAMVISEMADSAIIRSFARTVSGNVSAGENAVALV